MRFERIHHLLLDNVCMSVEEEVVFDPYTARMGVLGEKATCHSRLACNIRWEHDMVVPTLFDP